MPLSCSECPGARLGKARLLLCLLCITGVSIAVYCRSSWSSSLPSLPVSLVPQETRVCSCRKCLTEDDPWFADLMKASPTPFLSKAYTPSEHVYNWWRRLQWEGHSFSVYNETVKNLFQIFPPVPDVVGPSPDRCRTCAVVGNSGNLKGSRYGPMIDFHDIVIRMNRGRTKGYEADVGTKTTHHVMYPESSVFLNETTHLVLFAFKIKDLRWLLNVYNNAQAKKPGNKDLVMIFNPAYMKYVHEVWMKQKGQYPSTGFLTLALSMQMCDEVSVFGFGADSDGNWYHYFEVLTNKRLRTGPHAGAQEYEFIQKLHERGKIHFYKGS